MKKTIAITVDNETLSIVDLVVLLRGSSRDEYIEELINNSEDIKRLKELKEKGDLGFTRNELNERIAFHCDELIDIMVSELADKYNALACAGIANYTGEIHDLAKRLKIRVRNFYIESKKEGVSDEPKANN